MVGDGHMHDASALMGEDHQDEQQATGRCRHDEEVRGGDLVEVIRQEGAPRL